MIKSNVDTSKEVCWEAFTYSASAHYKYSFLFQISWKIKNKKKQLLIHNGRSMKVTIDSTLYEKKNPHIHSLQTMSTLCKVWINCYIRNCGVGWNFHMYIYIWQLNNLVRELHMLFFLSVYFKTTPVLT